MKVVIASNENSMLDYMELLITCRTPTSLNLIKLKSAKDLASYYRQNEDISYMMVDDRFIDMDLEDLFMDQQSTAKTIPTTWVLKDTKRWVDLVRKLKNNEVDYLIKPFDQMKFQYSAASKILIERQYDDFHRISAEQLTKYRGADIEVYLQVAGRLVLLKNREAELELDEKVKESGRLYVSGEDFFEIQKYFFNKVLSFIENKSITLENQIKMSVELIADAREIADKLGISEKIFKLVDSITDNVITKLSSNNKMAEFLIYKANVDGHIATRNLLTTYIAASVLEMLEMSPVQNLPKLVMAAIFCDIFLDTDEEKLIYTKTDMEHLAPATKSKILKHPENAALLVSKLDGDYSDVVAIIRSHHERPDGSGFPRGSYASSLPFLPSLFIFSQILATSLAIEQPESPGHVGEIVDQYDDFFQDKTFKKCQSAIKNLLNKS